MYLGQNTDRVCQAESAGWGGASSRNLTASSIRFFTSSRPTTIALRSPVCNMKPRTSRARFSCPPFRSSATKSVSSSGLSSMFIFACTANSISSSFGLAARIFSAACRTAFRSLPRSRGGAAMSFLMYATNSFGVPSGTTNWSASSFAGSSFTALSLAGFSAAGGAAFGFSTGALLLVRGQHRTRHRRGQQRHPSQTPFFVMNMSDSSYK